MSGSWVLFPNSAFRLVAEEGGPKVRLEEAGEENTSMVNDSQGETSEPDDSVDDFEHKLREILPSLQEDNSLASLEQPKGTRTSERKKKPSSKWNEDAGFLAELPKSTKIKAVRGGTGEGMPIKPLLISEWSNV